MRRALPTVSRPAFRLKSCRWPWSARWCCRV